MKSLITLTSIVLVGLIALYHTLEVQLFMIDNGVEDWRIAMTWQRISQILVEMVVCFVHPIPGNFSFTWVNRCSVSNLIYIYYMVCVFFY